MPSRNAKVITVAPAFAKMIDDGLIKANEFIGIKYKKKMTKIDYTDFLSKILKDDFGMLITHSMITPIKKSRKRAILTF